MEHGQRHPAASTPQEIVRRSVFTCPLLAKTLLTGDGLASPSPCTIQGYPPNAYLVTIGEGLSLREFVFQLDTGAKRLSLSVGYWQVPFVLKE